MASFVSFKSALHDEYLYAGNPMLDDDRRHALTWGGSGNPESDKDVRWIKDSLEARGAQIMGAGVAAAAPVLGAAAARFCALL